MIIIFMTIIIMRSIKENWKKLNNLDGIRFDIWIWFGWIIFFLNNVEIIPVASPHWYHSQILTNNTEKQVQLSNYKNVFFFTWERTPALFLLMRGLFEDMKIWVYWTAWCNQICTCRDPSHQWNRWWSPVWVPDSSGKV